MFLGQYTISIENGKIHFPWKDTDTEHLKCIYVKVTDADSVFDDIRIIKEEDKDGYLEEIMGEKHELLYFEDFNLLDDGFWQIPDWLKEYLKSDEIVLFGDVECVAIYSTEEFAKREKALDEFLNMLNS